MANDGKFDVRVMAKLLMLDERRIQQLVSEGWIPRGDRGRYGLIETVQGYIKFLKEHGREQQRGTEGARLARAQAVKVEMENFRRMGELQVTHQVDETLQGLIVIMKSSHEGLPGRLASELAGISDAPVIYQRLQTEFRAVLNQCADFVQKRADALEAMPDPSRIAAPVSPSAADDLGGEQSGDAAG